MSPLTGASRALLLSVCVCVVSGCATTRPQTTPAGGPLPDWVRVVPPLSADGRANYVGSCAIAVDEESGLAEAEREVSLLIEDEARGRFLDVYALVRREMLAEATPTQRFDFQNIGTAVFYRELASSARRDAAYSRPCGGAPAKGGGGAAGSGPVCSIFVLVSVDVSDWDHRVVVLLERLRDEVRAGPDKTLAAFADRLIRAYGSKLQGATKEGDRARATPAGASQQR